MTPLNVNLRHLIDQVDVDLPHATALAKVSEAQQRARGLNDIGDQLVDHFVTRARTAGSPWSQIGDALGVTKQAAQQRWVPSIFRRFTDRARHVVVLAVETARTHKHDIVETPHLLLGIVGEVDGLGAQILADFGGTLEALTDVLGLTPGTANPPTHLPFAHDVKAILDEGAEAALALGHDFVGTEHLLLGVFRVPDCRAAQALASLHITEDRVRPAIVIRVDAMLATAAKEAAAKEAAAEEAPKETAPKDTAAKETAAKEAPADR